VSNFRAIMALFLENFPQNNKWFCPNKKDGIEKMDRSI
jgi:hypothetical protein